jgi:release factor glutamine methyltransferase
VTVSEVLRAAAARLSAAGVESPEHDAEVLLRHVLGWDRARLVVEAATALAPRDEEAFRGLVDARASRHPLQHLTGTQWFWKHEFQVTPDVLIPRPETELLVETALELLRGLDRPAIVDVGTGSGCIALSLAAERRDAEVHATDVSAAALDVARSNAWRLGLENRVTFHHGDLLEPVSDLAGRVDLIASNPPYVDPGEPDALAPEVRDHEPALALFPPGDALSVYRRLAGPARALLRAGGWLTLEVSPLVAEDVARLLTSAGFEGARILMDQAGRCRVVQAARLK